MTAGVTFINAMLAGGEHGSLRVAGSHIAARNEPPPSGDCVVDLEGDRLMPGLINAHDHLQLNSLPANDAERRYRDVRDWIADVNAIRRSDPAFEAGVRLAREERLWLGGLKNLLSGVTSVAHHDPLYPTLTRADFPTAVLCRYGWSHSLYLDGEEQVQRSYRKTPDRWPWIIHAAEGLSEEAAGEFDRLDALGCVAGNTLLVHGTALGTAQRARLAGAGAGLVWCPSSNLRLFGSTAQVDTLIALGRVALGTDSRLSGARDLLDELRLVRERLGAPAAALEALATRTAARLLRLNDRGVLRIGARADLLVLPASAPPGIARRADVRLVMIEGRVRYGDGQRAARAAPGRTWTDVSVDGTTKILEPSIAARVFSSRAHEPGLEAVRSGRRMA